MHIEKIRVEGFRLLEDAEIMLEKNSTVIVGRNNSGKTSLTDVFDRFAGDNSSSFRLEDFSVGIRKRFLSAWKLRKDGSKPEAVLAELPKIVITMTVKYETDVPDLGPLSPFVIDLDTNCTSAIARVEYAANLANLDFLFDLPAAEDGVDEAAYLFRHLKDALPKAYSKQVTAVDPTDATNQRSFESAQPLAALAQCNLIRAQRALDHAKQGDPDVIGKLLSGLFKTASAPSAAATDQTLTNQLKSSVESVERDIQTNFDEMLKGLLPALSVFGFPSLNDTELHPETSLNVEALLADHTKIAYTGMDGVHLPEGYNGLGTRNLIFMLLQLEGYHKAYRAKATRPGVHLVFIEEPEAHLHPQMQEVFISQLNEAVKKLSANYKGEPVWPVQFIITTHSAHVANAAPFDAVRYFLNEQTATKGVRHTKVKDFKKGTAAIPPEDTEFLHQYMTLTKCDLYFADKAILIEGVTERILMPRFCEEVDKGIDEKNKLARQYVTTIEIGGAYSHLFYPLLDFLELKTLVITDLDAVKASIVKTKSGGETTKWVKCPVAEGERTSNTAIRTWFKPMEPAATDGVKAKKSELPNFTLGELAGKTAADKIRGSRRIAYQIPEIDGSILTARSFEDALVLANLERFDLPKEADEATEAWEHAQDMPKAETALRFAIQEKGWNVPRYIQQGLAWLSEPPPAPAEPPSIPTAPDTPATPESESVDD